MRTMDSLDLRVCGGIVIALGLGLGLVGGTKRGVCFVFSCLHDALARLFCKTCRGEQPLGRPSQIHDSPLSQVMRRSGHGDSTAPTVTQRLVRNDSTPPTATLRLEHGNSTPPTVTRRLIHNVSQPLTGDCRDSTGSVLRILEEDEKLHVRLPGCSRHKAPLPVASEALPCTTTRRSVPAHADVVDWQETEGMHMDLTRAREQEGASPMMYVPRSIVTADDLPRTKVISDDLTDEAFPAFLTETAAWDDLSKIAYEAYTAHGEAPPSGSSVFDLTWLLSKRKA